MARARNNALILAFAEALKAARACAGMSQEELAFAAGIDRTFVGMLENGKRQPTVSVLFALSEAMGIAPEQLVQTTRKLLVTASGDQNP